MNYSFLIILIFSSCVSFGNPDLGIKKNDTTEFKAGSAASYLTLQDKLKKLESEGTLNEATNVWFRSQSLSFSVYSRNKLLSLYVKKVGIHTLDRLNNEFGISLPNGCNFEIYIYRDKNAMSSYLKSFPNDFRLKRWHKDSTLMTYQLDEKNSFRSSLLYDDIPYMITMAAFGVADPKGFLPDSLRIGFAHSMEGSVSNFLFECTKQQANKKPFWVSQEELIEYKTHNFDEEDFTRRISGTAAAWAMFIKKNCKKNNLIIAVRDIINEKEVGLSLGMAIGLGKYDVLPRIEEKIKNWLDSDFSSQNAKNKTKKSETSELMTKIVLGLIAIILFFLFLNWLKNLIL